MIKNKLCILTQKEIRFCTRIYQACTTAASAVAAATTTTTTKPLPKRAVQPLTCSHGCNLGGGEEISPKYFFYLSYSFEKGQIKKTGVKVCVCVCIKDWFKPIFLLFLPWILRNVKFLMLMVDFPPPPLNR